MTFDELANLAKECRDQAAAQALLRNVEGCYWELPHHDGLRGDARIAIGYAAGYEDRKTQLRLWKLFETEHYAFAPDEILTDVQLLMGGYHMAGRLHDPENRKRCQKFFDDRDFTGLRTWLRTPLPGEPPWPGSRRSRRRYARALAAPPKSK